MQGLEESEESGDGSLTHIFYHDRGKSCLFIDFFSGFERPSASSPNESRNRPSTHLPVTIKKRIILQICIFINTPPLRSRTTICPRIGTRDAGSALSIMQNKAAPSSPPFPYGNLHFYGYRVNPGKTCFPGCPATARLQVILTIYQHINEYLVSIGILI